MRSFLLSLILLGISQTGHAQAIVPIELPESVQDFFYLNCYDCHNEVDKEGGLDLESLNFNPDDPSNMNLWAFVHDRIKHKEMPPKEDSLVEPEERAAFLTEFESILHNESRKKLVAEGRVKKRRLSRLEFQNTIIDLLGVDIPIMNLLPEEGTTDGFNNIAEGQQISYHLLQKYLEVVDLMLDEAFDRALNPPLKPTEPLSNDLFPTQIVTRPSSMSVFEGRKVYVTAEKKAYLYTDGEYVEMIPTPTLRNIRQENARIEAEIASQPYWRIYKPNELGVGIERINNERQGIFYNDQLLTFPTNYGFFGRMLKTTIPETGWYRIKLEAMAHNPPEGRNVWGRIHTGVLFAKAPAVYWVGKFEATRELKEFTFDAWIQEGHAFGIMPIDKTIKWVNAREIQDQVVLENGSTAIAIEQLEVQRIYPGLEPDALKQRLFGSISVKGNELISKEPEAALETQLIQFASRAFRRPIDSLDIAPYFAFAKDELRSTGSLLKALRAGYRAILISHRFLFFQEEPGRLDDFSIASRLSYFLWSSPPDDILITLAKNGQLSDPEAIEQQVERMLKDPKAEQFIKDFADSWLELRDIDFTTPDPKLYPEFDDILMRSMLDETYAFLQYILEENLSVTNIVDSDFTILNERIAHHYGIDFGLGTGLKKVTLDEADHRGGVITQASVLKVTANGTTTSPIIRGVWLLERILGKHIPPPPDQVPAVEPDIRGATNIRDQLDKHRSTPSCMACHQVIDPPGFALENYDVIGGWRDHYRAIGAGRSWTDGPAVDPSYELPDGRTFQDIREFKSILLEDPDQIARNLINQVLTYATGAEIQFADRREIEDIIQDLKGEGYGFRSLIHAVTQSEIFLSK